MTSSMRLRNSGRKCVFERVHDLVLHPLVAHRRVGGGEADVGLAQVLGAEVRRHDQHRVAEVDRAALAVGEPALLEDLQQRVEHVGVGLLDLVEQHHGERLAAHGLGELAALLVADVAGRRADEPADGVLLHVLAHVEHDQRRVVAEQELGERLGQLGLADAGRAEEDERAAGPLRVLETGPGAADRLGHGGDGALLADDPLVQLVLHVDELLGLLLGELVDRDAGPQAEHLGDGFLVDLVEQVDAVGAHLGLLGGLLLEQRLLLVAQASGLLEALLLDGGLLGLLHFDELLLDLAQIGRGRHPLQAQAAAGLVDEVDRLVGQEAVGDVAVGHVRRGDERLVGDRDPVVALVLVAQALQDLDRVGQRRLVDLAPAGSGARARRPSRRTCGTRRWWWRRWSAARRGRASA